MNNRCDICGCETESEGLKKYELSGNEYDICVFCRKRLEKISKNPAAEATEAVNMLYMDTKGRRNGQCDTALKEHFESLGIDTRKKEAVPAFTPYMPLSVNTANVNAGGTEIEELKRQISELNEKFNSFRRRYIISRVLGMVMPVVIVFVMLIILLASGALQSLFDYYGLILDYANM